MSERYDYHNGRTSLVPHLIGPPSHWSPISLVPHLIGPPSHWSPKWHPSTNHFIGPPSHWSPRLIGPPSHWSPISLVPFSLVRQLISPPLHYLNSLVPLLIGPPFISPPIFGQSHWSPISLVPHLIGPQISTHAPPIPLVPISLVPHPIGPFSPAGPPIQKSPPHCLNFMAPFSLPPTTCDPFYPVLIAPPPPPPPNRIGPPE